MRRTLILTLLVSLFATSAMAAPITIGLRGGSSIPNLRDNGGNELSSGWSSRVGMFFGASARIDLASAWSLQAELNYSGQGGKRDGMQALDGSAFTGPGTFVYANFKNESRLNYLEIPVLAGYNRGGAYGLHALIGPYVGILLSAKNVTSGDAVVYMDKAGTTPLSPGAVPFGATTDIKSSVNTFNWGLQAGLGAARPLGRGQVTLDVRGGLGLTNIQKDTAADGKNTTGALVVALGYAMNVGH